MSTVFHPCPIDGCAGHSHWTAKGSRGWCSAHYQRWAKHGDPLGGRASPGAFLAWLNEVALTFESDDCLFWPSTKSGPVHIKIDGKTHIVARVLCGWVHGDPPTLLHQAAHSCGNGHLGCINPGHLRWATIAENSADRLIHGTHSRGERHTLAKLTTRDVVEIRSRCDAGEKYPVVAADYDVSRSLVGHIATRKRWGWLADSGQRARAALSPIPDPAGGMPVEVE